MQRGYNDVLSESVLSVLRGTTTECRYSHRKCGVSTVSAFIGGGGMNLQQVVTVTSELDERIRSSVDEFIISSGYKHSSKKLHINDDGTPLCTKHRELGTVEDESHTIKDAACYPPGHKQICAYCATAWGEE